MSLWIDYFLSIGLLTTVIATVLMWFLRLFQLTRVIGALARLILGVLTMTIISAVIAASIFSLSGNVIQALFDNPIGGTAFFIEIGLETTIFWFPIVLIASLIGLFRKQTRSD